MTKALTITWSPSDNIMAINLSRSARLIKITEMCLKNKTSILQSVIVNDDTVKRFFVDQAAVEEYLNFCRDLESRYQTKIDKIEITDI
jgi:hypothetical protein